MGKKLGCSEATIRRWESGEREVTGEIIQRICESCNVDRQVFDVRLSDSTDPGDHSTNGITGLDKHIAAYCNYVPDTRDGVCVREARRRDERKSGRVP